MTQLKITIEQWRMFKAVADHGGFNQAAQEIHKSQSSIHSAVHKIEGVLGVKLFRTEGRKLVLTDPGRMLLRRAEHLLEEATKLEAIGLTLSKGVESKVYLSVDEALPKELLYDALQSTIIQFPLFNIEIEETILKEPQLILDNDKADITISPYVAENVFSEELCQIKFILVAAGQHDLVKKDRALHLEDLKSYRQIVVRGAMHSDNKYDRWLYSYHRWIASHIRTSIEMVVEGLGFAWLPQCMINTLLQSGKLKELPLSNGGERMVPMNLIYHDIDRLGPVAKMLVAELKKQCKRSD